MLTWIHSRLTLLRQADEQDDTALDLTRCDFFLAFSLSVVLGAMCFLAALNVDPVLYQYVEGRDVWFDGDTDRIFSVETSRSTGHASRNSLHPLYSLLTYPPVWFLRTAADLSWVNAVRVFHAAIAGLWFASFYLLLRCIRCRVPDALVFSAVAGTSASAILWFVVPESFVLGSLSILPSLVLCAIPARRMRPIPFVLAGAASLSITVSNFMFTVLATHVRWPWRNAAMISLSALVLLVALAMGQKLAFPHSKFPLESLEREKKFFLPEHSGGPVNITRSFFFHTMVMPKIEKRDNRRMAGWDRTTVQRSKIGSASGSGRVAAVAWAVLFAFGVYGLLYSPGLLVFRVVLAGGLGGQWVLHLLYGYETFLFSPHFMPLLVAVAALGCRTQFRPYVLALALVFSGAAFLNNADQRKLAYEHVKVFYTLPPPSQPPAGT